MTSTQTSLSPSQIAAAQLVADLSNLVKNPIEWVDYLQAHATLLTQAVEIQGLSYYLTQGNSIPNLYTHGHHSDPNDPNQTVAFNKALQQVITQGKPFVLAPRTIPEDVLKILSGSDAVSPEQLSIFNQTPYFQVWIPILLNNKAIGVLRATLVEKPLEQVRLQIELISRACAVIELYLKSRQVEDILAELTRLRAYEQFLEKISGELELDTIADAILAFMQTSTNSHRVSLLVADAYAESLVRLDAHQLKFHYKYWKSIGAQCPEPTSQQARALEGLGLFFLEQAQQQTEPSTATTPSSTAILPQASSPVILSAPAGKRPSIRLLWVERHTPLPPQTPAAVADYLALSPMAWATYLPVVDEQNRIVGIILLEGKSEQTKPTQNLLKLQNVIYAGGHALATALFWQNRTSLRWAKKWIHWKDGTLNTPKKRRLAYVLTPIFFIACILSYPIPFNLKAPAQLQPKTIVQLAAQDMSPITQVWVHEGDVVQKDQVLVTLDTQAFLLQRRRLESDFLHALAESDLAQGNFDEVGMQMAQFKADRAEAQLEAIDYRIRSAYLKAPFDGIVLGPKNMQQKVGQIAKIGEVLAEIAQPDDWAVKVQLYEQDIVYLEDILQKKGAIDASLKLTAQPDQRYTLKLENASQLAHGLEPRQEDYFFIGMLDFPEQTQPQTFLKTGFSGRVAFHIGRRPIAYILLRDLVRYLKTNLF